MTKALRYNQGKIRLELIPTYFIAALAKTFEYGASKYADHNWMNSINTEDHRQFQVDRYASAYRHLLEWKEKALENATMGDIRDEESGLPALWMAAWNCLVLAFYDSCHQLSQGDAQCVSSEHGEHGSETLEPKRGRKITTCDLSTAHKHSMNDNENQLKLELESTDTLDTVGTILNKVV